MCYCYLAHKISFLRRAEFGHRLVTRPVFSAPTFRRMIVNTVKLSLFSLLWSFPVPIILSLAINQHAV